VPGLRGWGLLSTASRGTTCGAARTPEEHPNACRRRLHNIAGGDITSKQNLEYNLRHGVKHLTVEVSNLPQGGWDPHELERMKGNCDKYGVVLEAIRMKSEYICNFTP
jgi:hypothetical protein